jgi:hypothetical protein
MFIQFPFNHGHNDSLHELHCNAWLMVTVWYFFPPFYCNIWVMVIIIYWVYLVPMVLRKHTLYNIRYLSFEWICIYTNILWYELIKNNKILLKQECWPCVQVIDSWQFSDGTFFFFTLTSFRCTGNSLLWRAIWANMLDCCGELFISDIFEPNKRIFYYFNSA